MKARRFDEMKALMASTEFHSWWQELVLARLARDEAREKHDELLTQAMLMEFRSELAQQNAIDTLDRAREDEEAVAQMSVEAQELENSSFKLVAEFEEQRYHATEMWYRLGNRERATEELKEKLEAARTALREKKAGAQEALEKLEGELKIAERGFAQAAEEYERENGRKDRLWLEVERLWARTIELSLLSAERTEHARKVRKHAERLFSQAEERKQRAKRLREDADAVKKSREGAELRVQETMRQAGERFGCAIGEEFVYFRCKEDQKRAWCVPLVDDHDNYNLELKPLTVYSAERQRGVAFLEPAVELKTSDAEGDKRFEEFFLTGRKGTPITAPPEEPAAKTA